MIDPHQLAEIQRYAVASTWFPEKIEILNRKLDYPLLIKALDTQLNKACISKTLFLPNFPGEMETLFIASDYGGEHRESKYYTYSFVAVAFGAMSAFIQAQETLRILYHLDSPFKELSFKTLSHGPTRRALDQYLANLSNLLPGIVITAIVDKQAPTLWGGSKRAAHAHLTEVLESQGFQGWRGATAEKMLNIVHVVSYIVALFAKSFRKVYWMTDNDAIAANPNRTGQLGGIFCRNLGLYTDKIFETVGYGTPFEERTIMPLDVLSCADLVAGTLEHINSRKALMGERFPTTEEANKISVWLSQQGISLKKFAFSVTKEGAMFKFGTSQIIPSSVPADWQTVILPRSD
jgi:hypothetical protein